MSIATLVSLTSFARAKTPSYKSRALPLAWYDHSQDHSRDFEGLANRFDAVAGESCLLLVRSSLKAATGSFTELNLYRLENWIPETERQLEAHFPRRFAFAKLPSKLSSLESRGLLHLRHKWGKLAVYFHSDIPSKE